MDVVHSWCKGAKFADICKMTNIFEGSHHGRVLDDLTYKITFRKHYTLHAKIRRVIAPTLCCCQGYRQQVCPGGNRLFANSSKFLSELEAKFAEGINKIKRDIVFAVSLYL